MISNINIVSSNTWMILKTCSRFSSCYSKFLTVRWRTTFILTWSWKFNDLVLLLIVLFVESCCKGLFIFELFGHILNKSNFYIWRTRLFFNFKNFSLWFRYCIIFTTSEYSLSVYIIFEKCLGSFIFIIETAFNFSRNWFTHSSLNTIIKARYFEVCISYLNTKLREGLFDVFSAYLFPLPILPFLFIIPILFVIW
jgi:hypothetical protein